MPTAVEKTMSEIDWVELHKAKQLLVGRIWMEPDNGLWFLVGHINDLQQAAIEDGLWSFPEKALDVLKSEVLPTNVKDGELCWDPIRAVGMERCEGEWKDIEYELWVSRHKERMNQS